LGENGGRGGCVCRAPAHVCRRRRLQRHLTAADAIAAAAVDLCDVASLLRTVDQRGRNGWVGV